MSANQYLAIDRVNLIPLITPLIDRRKGDGAEIPVSFPITSNMEVLFKQPLGSEINLHSFAVDISSWYE
jgi:hypothetical protein